ncbi:uncharacterized protein LOC142324565 isoform X2 [Lycorma delicatula]|uniref:uncharacterized protein LOC142324565 isoform X2 n=1 Tax=Lycorma delicatula TaxID=130591 RepID=UPI003F51623B
MLCLGAAPFHRSSVATNTTGDRLVEVDGQSVRCPETARELLRTSSEVVRLQLLRHGLNGHRLEEEEKEAMGSNLSRHSGKGLTGRRSQSSGNLCNGKVLTPGVGRFFSPCGRGGNDSVGPRDRYKFCGSLPNHLDAKDPVPEDDCSYRNNNNEPLKNKKSDLELRLHPLAKGDQDQGYASERSPEDLPPPPPPPPSQLLPESCPLVTPENTFTVSLVKGSRGLGLSLTGGMDSDGQWPGLVRIKRLFPHQPAWECGLLKQGDILLTANNTPLTGLTNYEALEVLRTTPSDVVLTVCRPPGEIIPPPEVTTSAPPPPRRDPSSTSHLSLPLKQEDSFGEFEVVMTKVNGSLGFTLRKEDESVLGHYVRALVREPALSDGRIKPGDKIVAVNDVDMSRLTHEEAVMFLRQCGQEVKLRLYRDRAQTPVCALSPVQSHSNLHHSHKPILRKEAQDMLSDLAVKKSQSPGDSGASSNCRLGRSSSPRKRRIIKTPSPDSKPDGETDSKSSVEADKMMSNEPLSMPPLSEPVSMPPLLTSSSGGFSYRNPAYRSANPTAAAKPKNSLSEELPDCSYSDQDLLGGSMQDNKNPVEGTKGLLKWKGVVFSPEEGTKNSSPDDSISQITECDASGNQILVVELNRGWNSRLGFSLQSIGQNTVISAIYPDSVASRDGRLHPGDQLIMVNDESVEGMNTSEVIDLLRKIRGSICITVWRKNAMLTSASSTAATISAYTNISSSSSSSSSSSATTQVHQQPEKQDNRK